MNRKTLFSLLIAGLLAIPAFAQREETILNSRNWGFSGFWGGYRHQLTQFGNTNSYMRGGTFGLEFGKTLLVGGGAYQLTDDFSWDQIQNQNFDMQWGTLDLGYHIVGYKAIHPMINVSLGPGSVKLSNEGKDNIFVVQPSAGIGINIFRWMHLDLEGGYRFVTDNSLPSLSDKDLSGAFGQVALKFGFSWGRYHKRSEMRYDD